MVFRSKFCWVCLKRKSYGHPTRAISSFFHSSCFSYISETDAALGASVDGSDDRLHRSILLGDDHFLDCEFCYEHWSMPQILIKRRGRKPHIFDSSSYFLGVLCCFGIGLWIFLLLTCWKPQVHQVLPTLPRLPTRLRWGSLNIGRVNGTRKRHAGITTIAFDLFFQVEIQEETTHRRSTK